MDNNSPRSKIQNNHNTLGRFWYYGGYLFTWIQLFNATILSVIVIRSAELNVAVKFGWQISKRVKFLRRLADQFDTPPIVQVLR